MLCRVQNQFSKQNPIKNIEAGFLNNLTLICMSLARWIKIPRMCWSYLKSVKSIMV